MSWQDDINTIIFTIITGDGKSWTPKWLNAQKSQEYNSSIFEFVNVEGSLVLRQKPKSRKFDLEFYFDGENAVEQGNAFELSARNSKYWTVKHPFYGNITCQPLSLSQDNSKYNVSKFIIPVVETILEKYPKPSEIKEDVIANSVETTNQLQADAFANSGEINKVALTSDVNYLDKIYSQIVTTNAELLEFKNLVSEALIELESSTATPLSIIRNIQALINYPATIVQSVEERINTFEETIIALFDSLDGTRENKFRVEAQAGGMIGAILLASSTNIVDDYETRSKVLAIQDRVSSIYNTYLTNLDALQTDRADNDESYIPNFSAQNSLNEVVNYAISNLFDIAFAAKQEREYILDKDSNLILLTHIFYGLDSEDDNINKFISTNNIGINEILSIKKGRTIIYYV
jgi:predicted nucleic acid-binding protein